MTDTLTDAQRREADAARKRAERERDIAAGRADPSLIPHGTPRGLTHWACDGTYCGRACHKAEAERRSRYPRYPRKAKA